MTETLCKWDRTWLPWSCSWCDWQCVRLYFWFVHWSFLFPCKKCRRFTCRCLQDWWVCSLDFWVSFWGRWECSSFLVHQRTCTPSSTCCKQSVPLRNCQDLRIKARKIHEHVISSTPTTKRSKAHKLDEDIHTKISSFPIFLYAQEIQPSSRPHNLQYRCRSSLVATRFIHVPLSGRTCSKFGTFLSRWCSQGLEGRLPTPNHELPTNILSSHSTKTCSIRQSMYGLQQSLADLRNSKLHHACKWIQISFGSFSSVFLFDNPMPMG